MNEPAAISPRLAELRHLWATIARDLVLISLPQTDSETTLGPGDICQHYRLSGAELLELMRDPDFKELLAREKGEAEALGRQAPHVLRTTILAAAAAEEVFTRLKDPAAALGDVVKAYIALAKSAGLDETPRARKEERQINVGVGLNISLPELTGGRGAQMREVLSA